MKCKALLIAFLVILLPVCFADEISLIYDANGNLVTGDGIYREYNSLNQLWKVYNGTDSNGELLQEYVYHPTEERVLIKKIYESESLKETAIYHSKSFVRVINDSGEFNFTYVYHNGQLVSTVNPDSSKIYHHSDHLGSTSVITDEEGDVVERTEYSPFGGIVSGGEESRYDYEAKEYDSLLGSYDFHFRQYNPQLGLFMQPDTLIQNVYDPQSLNRYMFERGNPYKHVDEDGHNPYAVAGIAGFIVGSVQYMMTHEGSGWSHMGKTYAHGFLGAGIGVASVAVLTNGGRISAQAGAAGVGIGAKMFGIGVADYVSNQLIDGEEFVFSDMVIAGGLNAIPIKAFSLKAGTFVSMKNALAKNTLKINSNILLSKLTTSLISSGLNSINLNQIVENTINNLPGTQISHSGTSFDYVTEDGRVYPGAAPGWQPTPGVERVCVSGC